MTALAESTEDRERGWKWRVFSIGGVIGLLFGGIYVLLPALSALVLIEPIRPIPIPWIELTLHTELGEIFVVSSEGRRDWRVGDAATLTLPGRGVAALA